MKKCGVVFLKLINTVFVEPNFPLVTQKNLGENQKYLYVLSIQFFELICKLLGCPTFVILKNCVPPEALFCLEFTVFKFSKIRRKITF